MLSVRTTATPFLISLNLIVSTRNITVEIAKSTELQLHENGSDWSISTSSVKVKERNDTIQGVKVENATTPGLYIIDDKKVIVK